MRIRRDFIPFGQPCFSEEEISAVTQVLRTGWVGMGKETIAFEKELSEFLGVPHIVTVNSCTSALFLSLVALGIERGDEVICPSLTWCATANAALYLGAVPVFCDIDPETLCITPETVKEKVTHRTKAVMIVHYGGLAVDVDAIRSVLPESVAIVEDAAHAFGSVLGSGKKVGASGNLTCFSFYANKNLSTGEGGAISLFDPYLADRLRSLSQNCMQANAWKRYSEHNKIPCLALTELGYKMNFTDLQACIGRVQLKRQKEFALIRSEIAQFYYDKLQILPVRFQQNILSPHHARHLFVIIIVDRSVCRDTIMQDLRERNVGASIHYSPLHRMMLYQSSDSNFGLPITDSICKRILTLPISSSMSVEDAGYIVDHLSELVNYRRNKSWIN